MSSLRITENFLEDLSRVYSARLQDRIKTVLELLKNNPEAGSPLVRESLTQQFGTGIRKFPISIFILVYRYDGEYVDVLALVYGARVT